MSEFLFQYVPIHPTTWVYLSSLLLIGLFFKFNRFWSVRNIDLLLLILLSPGLLLVHFGERLMAGGLQSEDSSMPPAGQESPGDLDEAAAMDRSTLNVMRPVARSAVSEASLPGGVAVTQPSEREASQDVIQFESPDASSRVDAALVVAPPAGEPSVVVQPSEGGQLASSGDAATEGPAADVNGDPAEALSALVPGRTTVRMGYIWLLAISGVFMLRMLLDPTMVRRPLLEPNLSTGGLVFIGCSLFVFLMANVINSPVTHADVQGAQGADQLLARNADAPAPTVGGQGPGNALLHFIPSLVTNPLHWQSMPNPVNGRYVRIAKTMAVLSNLAIVLGIVLIGYRHFGSTKMGLGAAALYLMLPYNSLMAGHIAHVLPAALLVWGVLCYRRPLWAGMFIGMSIGVVYYPLFLLPLWISFYWQRGLMRFVTGIMAMLSLSLGSLIFISTDVADYWSKVRELFGIWLPTMSGLEGIWGLGWDPVYRIPVLAAFIAVSGALALWPAQKNLGTLLSCSSAIMLATQFWHGHGGGLFMAWFLPLTLLTIFRPNLEDRVALSVLGEGWFPRRKLRISNLAA